MIASRIVICEPFRSLGSAPAGAFFSPVPSDEYPTLPWKEMTGVPFTVWIRLLAMLYLISFRKAIVAAPKNRTRNKLNAIISPNSVKGAGDPSTVCRMASTA